MSVTESDGAIVVVQAAAPVVVVEQVAAPVVVAGEAQTVVVVEEVAPATVVAVQTEAVVVVTTDPETVVVSTYSGPAGPTGPAGPAGPEGPPGPIWGGSPDPVPVEDAGLGTDGASPPVIVGFGVRGWLRAIYERLLTTLTVDVTDRAERLVGHVEVDNLPATQPVSGTVTVANPTAQGLTDEQIRATPLPVSGTVEVSNPTDVGLTDEQIRATALPVSGTVAVSNLPATQAVQDDFLTGEVLNQQAGAGAVLVFTFSQQMVLIVVESIGDTFTSRADPFGGTPTAVLGVPCHHETPTYLPVRATVVNVFAPTGVTVVVWGYRR